MIEQIDEVGVEREIEADRRGAGVAGRKQEPGNPLPPRIRVGSARHGRRRFEARQHHVVAGEIERGDVERRQSERGKRRRGDLDTASVKEADANPAELAKPARDEGVRCGREARARRVARVPGGRAPVPKVTTNRCSMPASAARSRRDFEYVWRRRCTADHVGGGGGALEVRARQLVHRLGEPEASANASRRRNDSLITNWSAFLGGAEGRLAGAGRRGNHRDDQRVRRAGVHGLRHFQPSATSRCALACGALSIVSTR